MVADLHCHTLLSDGSLGIEDLIMVAKKSGVETIAITDHDTLAGTVRGTIIGKRYGVQVIPAVEFSCYDYKRERKVHLISYMADSPDRLEGLCKRTSVARKRAGQIMLLKLANRFPVSAEYILKCAAGSTNLYKQHMMKALMNIGYADEVFGDLFQKLFVEPGEENINVPVKYPDVFEVLREINDAGGISVLAHPAQYDSWELMEELIEEGLCGIEAWHPTNTEEDTQRILKITKKHKLVSTGGSDFHGAYGKHCRKIGSCGVPEPYLHEFMTFKSRQKRAKKKAMKEAAEVAAK